MITRALPRTFASFGLLSLLAACPGNMDEMAAEEAADSQDVALNEAALLSVSADDAPSGMGAAEVSVEVERKSRARFQPEGCATVTRTANVVTHVLDGCTGPRGWVRFTGTLTTTFSDAADGLHIHLTSKGLQANRATMDIDATGVLSDVGGKKQLVVTSTGSGIGPRGTNFTRTGQYTAVGDPSTSCLALDGQWQLDVGRATRSTRITGFEVCKAMCPSRGRIEHTGFRGRVITIDFDGSAEAKWSSSRGFDGTVSLGCGG